MSRSSKHCCAVTIGSSASKIVYVVLLSVDNDAKYSWILERMIPMGWDGRRCKSRPTRDAMCGVMLLLG
eukprot:5609837-Prorocentrum_lima.AAC.1